MNIEDNHNFQNEEEAARRLNAARAIIDPAEREELDRMARAEAARASMTPLERKQYQTFVTNFASNLPEITVIASATSSPNTLCVCSP